MPGIAESLVTATPSSKYDFENGVLHIIGMWTGSVFLSLRTSMNVCLREGS